MIEFVRVRKKNLLAVFLIWSWFAVFGYIFPELFSNAKHVAGIKLGALLILPIGLVMEWVSFRKNGNK